MFKVKSLYRLVVYSIIFILFLTSCFTFIILHNAQNELHEKIKTLKENYTSKKKILLKNDVNTLLRFIIYYNDKYEDTKTPKQIQTEVIQAIQTMKNPNSNKYFFIYDFDGNLIYTPKENIAKKSKSIINDLIEKSKKDGGGFVKYKWFCKDINSTAPKISYSASYKKWNWTIGKGVYLYEIDELVKQKEKKYDEEIENYIYQIAFLAILLALYAIFIYKNATRVIIKDVKKIRECFEEANVDKPINTDNLSFGEFKIIANYASNAIKTIQTKRKKLENINKNLENIVSEKTAQLTNLVQSQKKFIKYSVHEVNTPLSIIRNNIDLLKMKTPNNKYITDIESGAKMIQCIFDELAYLVKKDRVEYKKEYLNFSQVLTDRIKFFDEVAKSNSLNFECEIKDDIYINFNHTQLQRIIDNNLTNAIKYSHANSLIKIYLDYFDDKKIEFEIETFSKQITDTKRIFYNFYREDDARGGFGLGLGIVKEICDKNLIMIDVKSNKKTTKFIYRFTINENTAT